MFEIPDPLAADSAEGGNGAHEPIAEPSLLGIPRLNAGGPHKIILPRRPGELSVWATAVLLSRFADRSRAEPVQPDYAGPAGVGGRVPCRRGRRALRLRMSAGPAHACGCDADL